MALVVAILAAHFGLEAVGQHNSPSWNEYASITVASIAFVQAILFVVMEWPRSLSDVPGPSQVNPYRWDAETLRNWAEGLGAAYCSNETVLVNSVWKSRINTAMVAGAALQIGVVLASAIDRFF